jgi:hypothetical protein
MRGRFRSAQNCGQGPSPGLLRNPTSPRTAGRGKRHIVFNLWRRHSERRRKRHCAHSAMRMSTMPVAIQNLE